MSSSSPSSQSLDSPAKQLLSDTRRYGHSLNKRSVDSPSKQLLAEFSQMLIDADRKFILQLDEVNAQREQAHREALAAAAAHHERIRKHAETVRESVELEIEAEQKRVEEEERLKVQRQREEKAKQAEVERQRQIAELQREEEERKRAAQQAKELADTQARLKVQKEQEEVENAKRKAALAEALNKEKEAVEAAKRAAISQPPPVLQKPVTTTPAAPIPSAIAPQIIKPSVPSATQSSSPLISSIAEREAIHNRYLDLHKRLKEFRKWMINEGKKDKGFKTRMGDDRRQIKARVGQLTPSTDANKLKVQTIRDVLIKSQQVSQPTVDIRQFMISPPADVPNSEAQVPALFVYLLHTFSKNLISQFIGETNLESSVSDQIGVLACKIFSADAIMWRGFPLIDMLLAKYHAVCPILWGIYGSEKTERGRTRLGWWRSEPGGPWVNAQTHGERMVGLASGFASLYMRDFSKVKFINPFPNYEYWRTLAYIVNTPAEEVTETHFLVLKPLIEKYAAKFIQFYGHAAVVVLRFALVEFPKKAPQLVASKMLQGTIDILKRDLHLTL